MSEENDKGAGYKKPPRKSQFVKGQSGNPEGRPKGSRNKTSDPRVSDIILGEAGRLVDVKSDGQKTSMSMFRAIMRAVNIAALKGDVRAQRIALNAVLDAESLEDDRRRVTFERALQYKESSEAEVAEAERQGHPRPKFLLDPDNIMLDPITGDVTVSTLTDQQHKAIEAYHNYRWWALKESEEIVENLAKENDLESLKKGVLELHFWIKKVRQVEKNIGGPFKLLGDGTFDALDMDVLRDLVRKSRD